MTDYTALLKTHLNVAAKRNGDQALTIEQFEEIKASFLTAKGARMSAEKFDDLKRQVDSVRIEDALHRVCQVCKILRSIDDFYVRSKGVQMHPWCKSCNQDKWQKDKNGGKHFFAHSYSSAKKRAAAKKLPFDIDVDYLNSIFPKDRRCPILGIVMEAGVRGDFDSSPSLDKIIPEKGYVRGNLWYISMKANRIKSDHSISDLLTTVYGILSKLKELGLDGEVDGELAKSLSKFAADANAKRNKAEAINSINQ